MTIINSIIEDIKGYKSFGKVLDIDFMIILLESQLDKEEQQIKQAYLNGREDESSSSGVFGRTADQYYETKYQIK